MCILPVLPYYYWCCCYYYHYCPFLVFFPLSLAVFVIATSLISAPHLSLLYLYIYLRVCCTKSGWEDIVPSLPKRKPCATTPARYWLYTDYIVLLLLLLLLLLMCPIYIYISIASCSLCTHVWADVSLCYHVASCSRGLLNVVHCSRERYIDRSRIFSFRECAPKSLLSYTCLCVYTIFFFPLTARLSLHLTSTWLVPTNLLLPARFRCHSSIQYLSCLYGYIVYIDITFFFGATYLYILFLDRFLRFTFDDGSSSARTYTWWPAPKLARVLFALRDIRFPMKNLSHASKRSFQDPARLIFQLNRIAHCDGGLLSSISLRSLSSVRFALWY